MKKYLIILSSLPIIFTSCLKDENVENRVYGLEGIEEAKTVALLDGAESVISLNASASDTTFAVVTANANSKPPASDITVEFEYAPELIDAYNEVNGTGYVAIDEANYSLPNGLVATIPAGENEGGLMVTLTPDAIVEGEYALAFRIKTVSSSLGYVINPNAGESMVIIGVKNKYDGVYSLRIKTAGWGAYAIADADLGDESAEFPYPAELVTSGGSSVDFYTPYGAFQVAFSAGNAGPATFGATAPRFVFDNATNQLVNVINLAPDDGRGRTFKMNPDVTDSRFDPDTRTIYAAYLLTNIGRPDMQIYDTLTYIGPR